jgi:hypothetical protein
MTASPGTGTAATVDQQQTAGLHPGFARRLGFLSAVIFTLSILALDVTETVAMIPQIGNDPLSVAVSIPIPLAFVAMLVAIHTSTLASRRGGRGVCSA